MKFFSEVDSDTLIIIWILLLSFMTVETASRKITNRPVSIKESQFHGHTKTRRFNGSRISRKRRYDYEDTYDWEYDDSKIDYKDDTDENGEVKRLMLNWQKIAIRLVFIVSVVLMLICCCWYGCRNFFKICCGAWYNLCRNMCNMCLCLCSSERDPVYQQVKTFSEQLGIKIDYATYKNMKEGAVQAVAESGFKPNI